MKYRGERELYDMDADRTELHNLAAAESERMAAQWDVWAARTHGDPWEGTGRSDWGGR